MKHVLTTLAIVSSLTLVACNKTKKLTQVSSTSQSSEVDMNVEFDGSEIIVMVNGEEIDIDLSEILEEIDFENVDGEVSISLVAISDNENGESGEMELMLELKSDSTEDLQFETIRMIRSEGRPHEGMERMQERMIEMRVGPEGMEEMHERMMQMRGGPRGGDMHGDMEEMHEIMMQMHEGPEGMQEMRENLMQMHGGPRGGDMHGDMEEMHEIMMQMRGGPRGGDMHGGMEEMHERMMQMHGGPRGGDMHGGAEGMMHGQWMERDIPEEHRFIEELELMHEVGNRLYDQTAMSILGIRMIRDQLEPAARIEALESIIESAGLGTAARNASLLLAIETLQELGREDESAELMVELVLSNAH